MSCFLDHLVLFPALKVDDRSACRIHLGLQEMLHFYLLWIDTEWKIKHWDVFPQYTYASKYINCDIFKEPFNLQSFYSFVDGNVVFMAWHSIGIKCYDLLKENEILPQGKLKEQSKTSGT